MTTIAVQGEDFYIDGQPTHAGRTFEGRPVQGLLFNVRAAQATFDDANPHTRQNWRYPDTGVWDPDRNTAEFCDAVGDWRRHGVLGFTINFQGGGAIYVPDVYDHFDNNAFTPAGDVKPAYADRVRRVVERADELGMVVIAGLFYFKHANRLDSDKAAVRAAYNALDVLAGTGRSNILVEIANETDSEFVHPFFGLDHAPRAIEAMRVAYPQLLFSTSLWSMNPQLSRGMPTGPLLEAVDYVLLHGNECDAEALERAIHAVRDTPAFSRNPKPLVVNEDGTDIPNLEAAWRNHVSWGYFDQGAGSKLAWFERTERERDHAALSGFQTPPVNWGINTPEKRTFFERVAEITGQASVAAA